MRNCDQLHDFRVHTLLSAKCHMYWVHSYVFGINSELSSSIIGGMKSGQAQMFSCSYRYQLPSPGSLLQESRVPDFEHVLFLFLFLFLLWLWLWLFLLLWLLLLLLLNKSSQPTVWVRAKKKHNSPLTLYVASVTEAFGGIQKKRRRDYTQASDNLGVRISRRTRTTRKHFVGGLKLRHVYSQPQAHDPEMFEVGWNPIRWGSSGIVCSR